MTQRNWALLDKVCLFGSNSVKKSAEGLAGWEEWPAHCAYSAVVLSGSQVKSVRAQNPEVLEITARRFVELGVVLCS